MPVSSHIEQFHGLPVFDFVQAVEEGEGAAVTLPEPASVAWKFGLDFESEESFAERWQQFIDTVDTERVSAVVIGQWFADDPGGFDEGLAAIVGAACRLPALRALFVGDITYEESEISWLELCDVTPLLTAFPELARLVVRGGDGLELKPVRHEALTALRFEAGGLPASVVRAVAGCELPALERLEFWLGVDEYGGDAALDDLTPFLDGSRFPALRHLGLQNSEFQDEIAAAVAHAPVVARLESLGLSMGVLTDEGAGALLEGQPLTHLRALDLHHHYLTGEMQERLRQALPGVEIDLSGAGRPDDRRRYVAVAE
ncbi:leucine-rich repeat domain-containing protein [Streptomyces kaniharaensis]|uniref:Leucine-rich repeat domain-containing protein n=1 Tax=Streptomyces kaniharaensis TaxID=212423 RepID=A0A6N7L5V3_9ACTN|nr:STM4015 family protein [Streptomyces kaniharaensis]MQS17814.1 leucine-rich repeat domain-containing protein [Streptomyces kaniharaensis]